MNATDVPRPSFNLVDQQWIPCVRLNGHRELLGLECVLVESHQIREIYDDSPLITASLHRLLLAILHDIFGPEDSDAWAALWKRGSFDAGRVREYLGEAFRRPRFDLFDSDHPFYQSSDVPYSTIDPKTKKEKQYETSIAKMAVELAAGNNDTLFDHSVDDRPTWVTPAEAARLLLACQGFAMGGRITFERPEDGSADAAPLVKGAVVIVRGQTLFHTLMLNLCCYSEAQGEPFHFERRNDKPAWDRIEPVLPGDRPVAGYLDLLTRQSRRVRLHPEVDADGGLKVRTVVIMKGEQFVDGFHRRGHETMVAFTRNQNATEKQDPWPALSFSENRALWRGCLSLFESIGDLRDRPKTLDWLNQLVQETHLPGSAVYPMDLFGLSSDQAKILLWRHERLPLPLALLGNRRLLRVLREAIELAEAANGSLRQAVWQFAKLLLLRDETKQPGTEQKNDIRAIVDGMGAEARYWSSIEASFHRFLSELPSAARPLDDETEKACQVALDAWGNLLRSASRRVFSETVIREDSSARSLKAGVVAERYFDGLLRKSLPPTRTQSSPVERNAL